MKLKSGVSIRDVRPEAVLGMMICEPIIESYGAEFVVTSVKDGKHMPTSLHYEGLAFDVRSRELPADKKHECLKRMREALGSEFDVLLEGEGTENEHLHIEHDTRPKVATA
jgi:hypothetical protein